MTIRIISVLICLAISACNCQDLICSAKIPYKPVKVSCEITKDRCIEKAHDTCPDGYVVLGEWNDSRYAGGPISKYVQQIRCK